MDIDQFRHIEFDTGGATPSPNTGNTGGSTSISQGGPLVRMAAAEAKQALLALASANLGVPVGEPDGRARASSRAAARPSPTASSSATSCSTSSSATTTLNAGVAPAKPVRASTSRSASPASQRVRHPGDRQRHAHVRRERPRPGMLHGRVVRPRGQGAYGDGTNPVPLHGRRELDQAHPGRQDRPRRQLPRRRRAEGVRRDPGGRAAEGARGRIRRRSTGGRQPLEVACATSTPPARRRRGSRRRRRRARRSSVDAAMASAAKTYSRDVQVPLPDARADRPERRGRGRDARTARSSTAHVKNGYGDTRPQIAAALNTACDGSHVRPEPRPRRLLRGRELVRRRRRSTSTTASAAAILLARRSASRSASSGCAGTSTAGTTTARPRCGTSRAASTRTASSSRWDATSIGMARVREDADRVAMVGQPMPTPGTGPADTTYSGTQYDIPNRRIIGKTVPTLNNYFKTSTLRAPNAPQTCFANEQVIDQLAYLAGQDPYQFRLNNISTAPLGTGVGVATANRTRASGSGATRSIAVAQGRELAAAGRELGQADRRRSARVAASRSAASRTRRRRTWPRSR